MNDSDFKALGRTVPRLGYPERWAATQKIEWYSLMAARPDGWKQARPFVEKDWRRMMIMSGRAWGKTRTALQWAANNLCFPPEGGNYRLAIVCRTLSDARELFDRDDGLISRLPPKPFTRYNQTRLKAVLWNGSVVEAFSSDVPQGPRSREINGAILDEASSFIYDEYISGMDFVLRRGKRPQMLVTTTPKRTEITRKLLELISPEHIIRGSIYDNITLSEEVLKDLHSRYEGRADGEQELHGKYIEEVPGALVKSKWINESRLPVKALADINIIAHSIGVDPQGAHKTIRQRADKDNMAELRAHLAETGLVIAGMDDQKPPHFYIIADRSDSMHPSDWARKAVAAQKEFTNSYIVLEKNQGWAMADELMEKNHVNKGRLRSVVASDSKIARLEPIADLYYQGRVHHIGNMPKLEDQLSSFTGQRNEKSPDRLDALVWAVSDLFQPSPIIVF